MTEIVDDPVAGRVVVVGSVNEDTVLAAAALPRPGETLFAHHRSVHQGGKGANQAVAAARAGGNVHLIAAIGNDGAGHRATEQLVAEGISIAGVAKWGDRPTGTAVITVSDDGENQIVVAAGANATLSAEYVIHQLQLLQLRPEDVVSISFETNDSVAIAVAEVCRQARATLVLNPSPYRDIPQWVLEAKPILVLNEHEAASMSNQTSPETAAQSLNGRTAAPVVVTCGSKGALLTDGTPVVPVTARKVMALDTSGAGDTLLGIFCSQLAARTEITEALRLAVHGASLSVTARGARDGMPTLEEIRRIEAKTPEHPLVAMLSGLEEARQ